MAKIKEVIDRVDENKPNAFSEKTKLQWLAALDGKVAVDVFLMDIVEARSLAYTYPNDIETELLVSFPHEDIYDLWLQARIDFENGEYDKYQNTMEMFNSCYSSFIRWFADTYEPAQGEKCGFKHSRYYISAYGLAVKHGFVGTEEEWITSLIGKPGAAVIMRYKDNVIQWKREIDAEWMDLLRLENVHSGYGYGEVPVSLGSITDDAVFLDKLNEQFDLTNRKTRQITFIKGGVTYIGTLWNAGNSYGTLTANSYTDAETGALLTKIVRNRVNGTWQPWEYENPPLKNNTEYRTIERYGAKPVYVKRVSLGALPNKSNKREVIVPTGSTIVGIDGYSVYTSGAGNEIYTPLVKTEGVTSFFVNKTTGQVGINTDTDLSTYTATVTVKYTK